MFTESDRVQIRRYLGFSGIFLQANPRLESAITAVQAISDGGTRPDNSSELEVRAYIAKLQKIDEKIECMLWSTVGVSKADEINIDSARGIAVMKQEGRRFVTLLSDILSCTPLKDCYSSTAANADGDSFNRDNPKFWG